MTLTLGFMKKKEKRKNKTKKPTHIAWERMGWGGGGGSLLFTVFFFFGGGGGAEGGLSGVGGGGVPPFQPLCFLCIGDYFYQCDARDDLVTASVLLFELPEIETEKERGGKKRKRKAVETQLL